MRPFELVRAEAVLGDVADLFGDDAQALRQVLLAGAHVDADLPGVGVLRGEGVDSVGEPSFLPDLLEEARGGRAAEDAVEERGREAAAVGARDPGRREAEVVLLRRLRLEDERRLRRATNGARAEGRRAGAAAFARIPSTRLTSLSWSTLPAVATTTLSGR